MDKATATIDRHNHDVVELNDTTEFGQYMGNIQRTIKMNWNMPRGVESYKSVVSFTVYKDGRLIGEPKIKYSSGNNSFDYSCLNAVRISSPFNPFPEDISKDTLDMDFTFEKD